MATRKAYLFAQSLGRFFALRLDQRFHCGFSTRQRAGLDYLEEGFHDVSLLFGSDSRRAIPTFQSHHILEFGSEPTDKACPSYGVRMSLPCDSFVKKYAGLLTCTRVSIYQKTMRS